jgi:hypothetical protein
MLAPRAEADDGIGSPFQALVDRGANFKPDLPQPRSNDLQRFR